MRAAAEPEWHYCKRCGGLLPGARSRRFEGAFLVMPYLNLLCAILAAASFVSLLLAFPGDSGGWAMAVAGVSCFLIAAYQVYHFRDEPAAAEEFSERARRGGGNAIGAGAGRHALNHADTSSFVRPADVTEGTT